MQDLNDLFYFVQVVDHGGYAAAGRAIGIPKSRLSRRIAALEDQLGVRLIQRTTRKLSVTEIGQEFYRHCVAMLVEANAAQEVIDRSRSEPQGLIRVSAPPALVCFQVGPMIARYMAANPRVTVELHSTSRQIDLVGEGVDIAIRVRFPPLGESDLVMRTLGHSPQRLVASASLFENFDQPRTPRDLEKLPSLGLAPGLSKHVWILEGADGAKAKITHQPRLVTDDMSQLLYGALEGVGAVELPSMIVGEYLASGRLLELLPEWTLQSGIVHAVFPSRRGLLPSVRSFIDFLVDEFANQRDHSPETSSQTI